MADVRPSIPNQLGQQLPPLLGHWQFQYQEQRIYLATGEVVEIIRQEPPLNNCRALSITEQTLTWHYEYLNGSPTGQKGYTVTRNYTRDGNNLLIVPMHGFEPSSTSIIQLTDKHLILLMVPEPTLGFAYEWETGFSK